MSRIHYCDLLIVVGCIFAFLILCWGLDEILKFGEHKYQDANDYDSPTLSDDHDFSTDCDCYEVADPYLRIDNLNHEIRGYLAQINTLHEIIYSLRSRKVAKHPNGGGGVRVEGPSHPASNADDSCDCA